MRKSTKAIAIVAATIIFAGMGTAAFAYWTASGSGTGGAVTGSTNTSDISALQTTNPTGIAPGVAAQSLAGDLINAGSGPGYVAAVTVSISNVVMDPANTAPGTCDATDYNLINPVMTVGLDIPVGTSTNAFSGAQIQFNNKATNQDACRGATLEFLYQIS